MRWAASAQRCRAAPRLPGGFFAAAPARGRAAAAPRPPRCPGLRYLQTGDAQMEAVIAKVRRVLNRDISILVLGETGTGKELLARAIHQDSDRARQPFVAVNCASIPRASSRASCSATRRRLHGRATQGRGGKILQAHGGTLFLDEIGDMPLALQARLLRVLQERQVTPLGSARPLAVDVAVVAATHRNLRDMIERQAFREDLYYRSTGWWCACRRCASAATSSPSCRRSCAPTATAAARARRRRAAAAAALPLAGQHPPARERAANGWR
jgi:transcriptional regulator of acetoin/glycerol metabolism